MNSPDEPGGSRRENNTKRPFYLKAKTIIGLLLAIPCLIFVFWLDLFDEPLSAEAKHWLTVGEQHRTNPDDAFLFLLGFLAPPEENVLAVGLARFQANREAMDAGEGLAELGEGSIEFPKNDSIYKGFYHGSTFETVVNASHRWKPELEKGRVLQERYLEFLKYDTMIAHPLAYYYSEFDGLKYGCRLRLFLALSVAEDGRKEKALDVLMADISRLRIHLAGTNCTYYKVILRSFISDYLDVLAHIHSSGAVVPYNKIASLTPEERSLKKTMVGYLSLITKTAKKPIYRFESPPEGWLVKRIFLPNKLANRALQIYQAMAELSTVPADQYAAHFDAGNEHVSVEGISRTREGALALKLVDQESFLMIMSSLHDLDCKIALVNHVIGAEPLINPYYPSQKEAVRDGGFISLDGPYGELKNRSLRLP